VEELGFLFIRVKVMSPIMTEVVVLSVVVVHRMVPLFQVKELLCLAA
jgi:hypothetical protein